MSGEGRVVCVTGASGFIASWLVKLLLDHGYTVRGTVRSLDDPKKTGHLLALDGAKERLKLFEANLTDEGSFDIAVEGCDGVFHTASPVLMSVKDPNLELIDPAVKGTLNVLNSCCQVSSIKRVVITSSMASAIFNGKPLNADVVVDETWFSNPDYCLQSKMWYMVSKTLAEEAAWKFGKENGMDLITIHPGFVIGPLLQPNLNVTSEAIQSIIKTGHDVLSDGRYRYVDVRDVAYAHVRAFEVSSAKGRYLMVGSVTCLSEIVKILRQFYPGLNLPNTICDEEEEKLRLYKVSKEKVKSLGVDFLPLEVSLKDTVESLREKNFLTF